MYFSAKIMYINNSSRFVILFLVFNKNINNTRGSHLGNEENNIKNLYCPKGTTTSHIKPMLLKLSQL
jgi:hypothetical protein